MDRFPSEQANLYNKIANRLSWEDWQDMAEAASVYTSESNGAPGDKHLARFLLRWLEGGDFVRNEERRFFHLR